MHDVILICESYTVFHKGEFRPTILWLLTDKNRQASNYSLKLILCRLERVVGTVLGRPTGSGAKLYMKNYYIVSSRILISDA